MSTVPKPLLQHAPVSHATLADPVATASAWRTWIGGTGLSDATKRSYGGEVTAFITWLGTSVRRSTCRFCRWRQWRLHTDRNGNGTCFGFRAVSPSCRQHERARTRRKKIKAADEPHNEQTTQRSRCGLH